MALVLNQWVPVASASQTKTLPATGGGYVDIKLTYSLEAMLTSQNASTGVSQGQVRARIKRDTGAGYSSYGVTATCLNCSPYSASGSISISNNILTTGTFTLYANSDGDAALHLSGTFTANNGNYSISADAWMSAPNIAMVSKPTCSPDPLILSSSTNTLTVTTNRKSNSYTHTVTVTAGSWTDTQTDVGASTTFAIPYSVIADMTADTMTCNVSCTTYNGTSQIGQPQTTTFNVQVDSSLEKAYVSSVVLSDRNATASALETSGKFIYGYSNLRAVVSFATLGSYTELVSYSISYDGSTQSDDLSGTSGSATFDKNGTTSTTMTITVTDNRGKVTTTTQTINLIDYRPVGFSEISIYRVNSSDQPTETGDYIHYEIKVNCFDGSFGQGGNPITLGYKYKLASGSTYGAEATIDTHTGTSAGEYTTYTFSGITGGGNLAYSSEYNIIFTLSDTFTSATSTMQVLHQGIPVFAWGEDHFDVYGEIHVHDRTDPSVYRTHGAKGTAWTSFGTVTGSNVLQFTHSDYEELLIVAKYVENASYTWIATAVIPADVLSASDQYVLLGARIAASSSNDKGCNVKISTAGASIYEFANNRTYVSGAELTVYYR